MATLVLGAVGYYFGGVYGAQIGAAIGQQIDSRYLFAPHSTNEMPQLKDLHVQSSAYGEAIPLVYGRARISGNVIWSSGLVETRHSDTQRVGGKGGGPKVTNVSYTYAASFAVGLSARPIKAIGRVWADGKLLRDGAGRLAAGGTLHVHTGDEAQTADARMQAALGFGAAPAHRGLAYVLFEDLQLADYGNRIPNLSFEVIGDDVAPGLGFVVADLAARAGVVDVDVTGLSGRTVIGFVLPGLATARDGLEALAIAARLVVQETGGGLRFLGSERTVARTLDPALLGARVPGQRDQGAFVRKRSSAVDVPAEIAVRYIDATRDYQASVQRVRRDVARPHVPAAIDLSVVMTASEAKAAAEAQMASALLGAEGLSLRLTVDHLDLEPGDVVSLDLAGRPAPYEIRRSSFEGAALALELAAYDDTSLFGLPGAEGDYLSPVLDGPSPTVLHLLDIPLLPWEADLGPRLLIAANGTVEGWRGAAIFASSDGGARYDRDLGIATAAVIGQLVLAPGAGPIAFPDPAAFIDVALLRDDMALESRDPAALLDGANFALVGAEILQFASAEQLPDGNWRLSGLLRGRCGTEVSVGGHVAGERFVLLKPGDLTTIRPGISDIGLDFLVKAVGKGETLESVSAQAFRFTAVSALPYAPVHIRCARASDGTATIGWTRRTRYGGTWRDGVDVPLAEESEAYEVEVLSGTAVLRRLSTTSPAVVYDAAMQFSDFGALPSSFDLRICQLSALLGRGRPLTATV